MMGKLKIRFSKNYICSMKNTRWFGVIYMIIATTCFALVNTCVKFLDRFPVQELVFFRSAVSIILCLVIIRQKKLPLFGNNKKWLLIRGVFGTIALTLFFVTLQNMPMASAVAIQYLSPIFTILIASLFFKETFKKVQIPFFILCIIGIVVLKGFDSRVSVPYLLLGISSALFSGVAYNAIRQCRETDQPINVVFYFPLVALPIMGIWCLFDFVIPNQSEWWLIVIMGVFTQIAQIAMTKALQSDTAAVITPLKYIGAIYAIAIGSWIFDEYITLINLIGITLILLGLLGNTLLAKRT
ncbi:MAG: drug/metabolite transporter (DMT)-like permease [Luteibaculaceae bacterium]|jgi:drug/metabolite transporter (DMT)-like permease